MSSCRFFILLPFVLGACSHEDLQVGDPANLHREPFSHVISKDGQKIDDTWKSQWGIPFIGPASTQSVSFVNDKLVLTENRYVFLGLVNEIDVYRYTEKGTPTRALELDLLGYGLLHTHVLMAGDSTDDFIKAKKGSVIEDRVDLHLSLLGLGHISLVEKYTLHGEVQTTGTHLTGLGFLAFTQTSGDTTDSRLLLGLLGGGHDENGDFLRFLFMKIPLGDPDES